MPMFKTCTACKETFIAESPFIKLCPICNARARPPRRNRGAAQNSALPRIG